MLLLEAAAVGSAGEGEDVWGVKDVLGFPSVEVVSEVDSEGVKVIVVVVVPDSPIIVMVD